MASNKAARLFKILLEQGRLLKNEWLHGRVGMWTILALTPSILILLDFTTSLSVRKLGLRAGEGCFLMYLPSTLLPQGLYPDGRGGCAGHLEEYMKSQWHPLSMLRYSQSIGLMGLSMYLLLPCPEFKWLLPRDMHKARKFLRATSIGQLVYEESNKVTAG